MSRNNKNQFGFTIIEVIITITIIGIILVLALPHIGSLKDVNKKFDAYSSSILSASKLYTDNNEEELFGNAEEGCAIITFQMLEEANLIKDISEKNYSCNSEKTQILVMKDKDGLTYLDEVTCFEKENKENIVYQKNNIKNKVLKCETKNDELPPTITAVPENTNNKWLNFERLVEEENEYKDKGIDLKFIINDASGLNKNQSIKWAFTTSSNVSDAKYPYKHNFHNKKLSNIKSVIYDVGKNKVPNDDNIDGKYYLYIVPNTEKNNYGIQDYFGNINYIGAKFGPYFIDNVAPTLNPKIVSRESGIKSLKINVQANATDAHGINEIYISTTGYEKGGKWQKYASSVSYDLKGTYDGKTRTIYITVRDNAGNIANKKINYLPESICPGNICYISSNGSDNGYGSKTSPFASIQKGFDTVKTGGKVVLLSNIKCSPSKQTVPNNKNVTLMSNGNNQYIIYRNDTYQGNIIYLSGEDSALTIKNIIIDGNFKTATSPMVESKGKLVIEDSVLRNARDIGTSGIGPTIHLSIGAELTLRNVEIHNNHTTAGGSAINSGGTVALYNVDIHDNKAWDGTIWTYGTLKMYSGKIYNNKAHYDAGVRNYNLFYMYGGEITKNVSEDQEQSGGLKNGCYHFGWGLYVQGTSEVCEGCIHDNSPRDRYTNYTYCDNPVW